MMRTLKTWMVQVALWLVLLSGFSVNAETSLAIVQLRPANIDAVGFDSDFTLAMRSAMEKDESLRLISRRDMEDELRRQGVIQDDKPQTAIRVGQVLSVPYVIIGTVKKQQFAYSVDVSVIDVLAQARIERIAITLDNRNELEIKAQETVAKITRVLKENNTKSDIFSGNFRPETPSSDTSLSDILSFADASTTPEGVKLIWQARQPSEKYNIYRAPYIDGPFQFLAVTRDTQYIDSQPLDGDNIYQISIVNSDNLEIRSQYKAKAVFSPQVINTEIRAPTILAVTPYVGAAKIDFLPSLLNTVPIAYYNVYRKRDDSEQWQLIDNIRAKSSQDGAPINDLTFLDKSLLSGFRYHYRLSSVSNSGSEGSHSPVQSVMLPEVPMLNDVAQELFREARLSWTPVISGLGYRLYRRTDSAQQWQLLTEIKDLSQRSYVDKRDLADGQSYQYTITIFDKLSESNQGDGISIATRSGFGAPSNLTTSTELLRKVTLNWEAISDSNVQGYGIYRGSDSLNEQGRYDVELIAKIDDRNASEYTDIGDDKKKLGDGESYAYAVSTYLINGEQSSLSPASIGKTKSAPRSSVEFATRIVDKNIELNWQYKKDIPPTWKVLLSRQWENHEWEILNTFTVDTNSYSDTKLKPFSRVRYSLIIEDADGLRAQPQVTDYVESPRSMLLLSDTSSRVRAAKLFWEPQQLIEGYHIYRKHQSSDNWVKVTQLSSASQDQYLDQKNLQDGIVYSYAITAYDGVSESAKSNIVHVKTLEAPSAPSGFSALSGEYRKVTLNWDKAQEAHANSYRIYKLKKGELEAIETIKDINVTSYVDDGDIFSKLKDDTEYVYAIATLNAYGGEGEKSETILATTKSAPFPARELKGSLIGNIIELQWTASVTPDIKNYSLLRSRGSCDSLRKFKMVNADVNLFRDDNITPGKTYCYSIKAVDFDGLESSMLTPVQVEVPLPEGAN